MARAEKPPSGDIEATGGAILRILASADRQSPSALVEKMGRPLEEIKLHLGRLSQGNLITSTGSSPGTGLVYSITQMGREWVAAHPE
jgi:hypothetical protein